MRTRQAAAPARRRHGSPGRSGERVRPLISVVVPAYNPGPYIEPCIRSLLAQTLPRELFEVIFVDDGSTDGTADRLDRLAREQPHVRVIRIPASGGPGRPRNVGLEAAVGEYVQFLDADDELAPRALERLLRMAQENNADIVVGKFASETMTRRQDLFTRNRGATTVVETPQLADTSMGPTKLFRAALLREHEISFPEGWRQMEDQLFTLRAYLAARVISILGDEPCYFFNKREDQGHISSERVDPSSHAAHLGEILDEIDRRVTDAELRRRLVSRFYRLEVLGRVTGAQFLASGEEYQARLFAALAELARDRFGEEAHDDLGAVARMRSRLLLEGRLPDLVNLGRRAEALCVDARITRASWAHGRLDFEYRAMLRRGVGGRPLELQKRKGALLLDPALVDDLVGSVDVSDELGEVRAQISVVDRETALEWIVPSRASLFLQGVGDAGTESCVPVLGGSVSIDGQRVGPGAQPLDEGIWDVRIRWTVFGMKVYGPLRWSGGARREDAPPLPQGLVGRPLRWMVPRVGVDGAVQIAIGSRERLPARIDTGALRSLRRGSRLTVELPIASDRSGYVSPGVLRLTGATGRYDLSATFAGSMGRIVVSARAIAGLDRIPRGHYEVTAHLGSADAPGLLAGAVLVRDDGRFIALGRRSGSPWARARSMATWAIRSATDTHRAWVWARGVHQRLPGWARDGIRSVRRRLRA